MKANTAQIWTPHSGTVYLEALSDSNRTALQPSKRLHWRWSAHVVSGISVSRKYNPAWLLWLMAAYVWKLFSIPEHCRAIYYIVRKDFTTRRSSWLVSTAIIVSAVWTIVRWTAEIPCVPYRATYQDRVLNCIGQLSVCVCGWCHIALRQSCSHLTVINQGAAVCFPHSTHVHHNAGVFPPGPASLRVRVIQPRRSVPPLTHRLLKKLHSPCLCVMLCAKESYWAVITSILESTQLNKAHSPRFIYIYFTGLVMNNSFH